MKSIALHFSFMWVSSEQYAEKSCNPDGVYAVSMKCVYNVSIPDSRVMRLKFQIFDLESDSGCR